MKTQQRAEVANGEARSPPPVWKAVGATVEAGAVAGITASDQSPMPVVYEALRQLARQRLATERPGHTLQATALVHDVYIKLAGEPPERWNDTAHFYHAAAEAMQRALVDHARSRARLKRGGVRKRVPLTETLSVASLTDDTDPDAVLALDAAVNKLQSVSPEAAAVVRLRFYAGLTVEQTAEAMSISPRTVKRKWMYARAWLFAELTESGAN
jgi:RNA polymerase sigma factor (TIGR02999 family)